MRRHALELGPAQTPIRRPLDARIGVTRWRSQLPFDVVRFACPRSVLRGRCLELDARHNRLKCTRTYPHGRASLCSMNGSTAPALGALLAKHQIDLTVDEVLDELDSAFAAIPGATTLSTTEVDFLRTHAEPRAAAVIDAWSADNERQARARIAVRQLTSALSGSVSIKDRHDPGRRPVPRVAAHHRKSIMGLRSPRKPTHPEVAVPW